MPANDRRNQDNVQDAEHDEDNDDLESGNRRERSHRRRKHMNKKTRRKEEEDERDENDEESSRTEEPKDRSPKAEDETTPKTSEKPIESSSSPNMINDQKESVFLLERVAPIIRSRAERSLDESQLLYYPSSKSVENFLKSNIIQNSRTTLKATQGADSSLQAGAADASDGILATHTNPDPDSLIISSASSTAGLLYNPASDGLYSPNFLLPENESDMNSSLLNRHSRSLRKLENRIRIERHANNNMTNQLEADDGNIARNQEQIRKPDTISGLVSNSSISNDDETSSRRQRDDHSYNKRIIWPSDKLMKKNNGFHMNDEDMSDTFLSKFKRSNDDLLVFYEPELMRDSNRNGARETSLMSVITNRFRRQQEENPSTNPMSNTSNLTLNKILMSSGSQGKGSDKEQPPSFHNMSLDELKEWKETNKEMIRKLDPYDEETISFMAKIDNYEKLLSASDDSTYNTPFKFCDLKSELERPRMKMIQLRAQGIQHLQNMQIPATDREVPLDLLMIFRSDLKEDKKKRKKKKKRRDGDEDQDEKKESDEVITEQPHPLMAKSPTPTYTIDDLVREPKHDQDESACDSLKKLINECFCVKFSQHLDISGYRRPLRPRRNKAANQSNIMRHRDSLKNAWRVYYSWMSSKHNYSETLL